MKPQYQSLLDTLARYIDRERLIHDPLRTLAYGTDASFYRLVPQLVVRVHDEDEVRCVLQETQALNISRNVSRGWDQFVRASSD